MTKKIALIVSFSILMLSVSYGQEEEKRLKLAGDLMIMSAKGTKKIRLSDLNRAKPTLPKGMSISTHKGTSTRKLD